MACGDWLHWCSPVLLLSSCLAALLWCLQAAAAKVGKTARVLIRINPDVDPQVGAAELAST